MLEYLLSVSELVFGYGPIEDTKGIVNSLVAESFGPNFRGDYHVRKKDASERGIGYIFERGDSPRIIAAENPLLNRVLSLGIIPRIKGYAGVLNEDGSEITVSENCLPPVRRYEELYKQRLKRDVEVRVVSPEDLERIVYPVNDCAFL